LSFRKSADFLRSYQGALPNLQITFVVEQPGCCIFLLFAMTMLLSVQIYKQLLDLHTALMKKM